MSDDLINKQLSSTLQAKLALLEQHNSVLFPKFNKIISGLLSLEDSSLTAPQLQQLVVKKQYALGKLSTVLPDTEALEANRRFTTRLESLLSELQNLWGDHKIFSIRDQIPVASGFELFKDFKRKYPPIADCIPLDKDDRRNFPAPQLKKNGV